MSIYLSVVWLLHPSYGEDGVVALWFRFSELLILKVGISHLTVGLLTLHRLDRTEFPAKCVMWLGCGGENVVSVLKTAFKRRRLCLRCSFECGIPSPCELRCGSWSRVSCADGPSLSCRELCSGEHSDSCSLTDLASAELDTSMEK